MHGGNRRRPDRRRRNESSGVARQARRPGGHGARPDDPGADGRHRADHVDGAVRVGPPPLRGDGPVHDRGRHPRPRADGHRRGGRSARSPTSRPATGWSSRSTSPAATAAMCGTGLQSQCETTQVREYDKGAALFGYTKLYGQVPGGQAELLRVPQAQYGPIKVPHGPPDDRFVYLSDVLPTAWQAVQYADIAAGRDASSCSGSDRSARWPAASPPTSAPPRSSASTSCPSGWNGPAGTAPTCSTCGLRRGPGPRGRGGAGADGGRGPDAVIDAVGMEAHGSGGAKVAQTLTGLLPDKVAEKMMERAGVDRLAALQLAIELVRRGGTISLSGVYGGHERPAADDGAVRQADPAAHGPGQRARWIDDLLPLVADGDVLGVEDFASHHLPLSDAPTAYEMFQKKEDERSRSSSSREPERDQPPALTPLPGDIRQMLTAVRRTGWSAALSPCSSAEHLAAIVPWRYWLRTWACKPLAVGRWLRPPPPGCRASRAAWSQLAAAID